MEAQNSLTPLFNSSPFPVYQDFSFQVPTVRYVLGIDWGSRFPVYAFGSNLVFHPIMPPNYIENVLYNLRREISYCNKHKLKKEAKRYKRALEDFIIRYVTAYATYLSGICYPNGIIAVEDQECFDLADEKAPDITKAKFMEDMYLRDIYIALSTIAKMTKNIDVIRVPRYKSSITCPVCGNATKKNRQKEIHQFVCTKCGTKGNDDAIAAWNIHNRGYEIVNGVKFPYNSYVSSVNTDVSSYTLLKYMEYFESKDHILPEKSKSTISA